MVQKYLMPSTTTPSSSIPMVVSMRKVRERLTAGSLPQLPKSLACRTTSS